MSISIVLIFWQIYKHLKLGCGPERYWFWMGASRSSSGSPKFAAKIPQIRSQNLAAKKIDATEPTIDPLFSTSNSAASIFPCQTFLQQTHGNFFQGHRYLFRYVSTKFSTSVYTVPIAVNLVPHRVCVYRYTHIPPGFLENDDYSFIDCRLL